MDDNSDEKVVKTKTLAGVDESTESSVVKGVFNEVDLTKSTSVDGGVGKSQENGCGVEEKGGVFDVNSVDGGGGSGGGGGGGDGVSVPEEFSTAKNGEVEKGVGVEGVGHVGGGVGGGGVSVSEEFTTAKNGEVEKGVGVEGVGDGGGVGDGVSVRAEFTTVKNGEVEKGVGVEGVGDGGEVEKGVGVEGVCDGGEVERGGEGDGVSVPEEITTVKNGEVEKSVGVEGVGDGGVVERGGEGVESGERKDEGFLNGSIDSGEKLSSIVRRTRNRSKTEGFKDEDAGVDGVPKGSGSDDGVNEENPFSVGDFVWGKIKSHPWWPGRIYDPSLASEFALNYKHEGRLLVAYFGDRTFAWCDPSQLKSFEENFEEMSKQSNLKTFVSAVEEAENEFGRLVKLQVTCSCVKAKESQSFIPFVVNGGIKEGVHVPENGISGFVAAHFDSSTMLADIRRLALFDLLCNSLEQTALKSILLAFYDAKYGYLSTINCESMSIEDAVDEGGVSEEASFQGPDDGESLMDPVDQELGLNAPRTPLDMQEEGRKSKTIAELFGMDLGDKLEGNNGTEVGTPVGESVVKPRKKRKKVFGEDQSSMPEETGNIGSSKAEKQSGKPVEKSARRKRKTIDESPRHVADSARVTRSSAQKKGGSGRSTTSEKDVSEETDDARKTRSRQKLDTVSRARKKDISVSINDDPKNEEVYERISPRERKLSKYLSPPYTIILQRQRSSSSLLESDQAGGLVPNDIAKVGERVAKLAGNLVSSPRIMKCSAQTFEKSSKSSGSKGEKSDYSDDKTTKPDPISVVVDPMEAGGSLNGVLHEIRSAARNPVNSKRHQSFDSVKGFVSSYRSSKYKNGPNYESFKKRTRNLSGTKHRSNQKVANEVHQQTPKPKLLKRSATKRDELKAESNQKVANEVDPKPKLLKRSASKRDELKAESNQKVANEVDQQTPKPKLLKRSASKRDELKAESNQKVANEVHQQTPKPKLLNRSASRREGVKLDPNVDHEASCGPSASSSALLITFPKGFPLPAKQVIVGMCRKFGKLDEAKTELVAESSTAKVIFVQSTCAEAAKESLRKKSPFGNVKVTYKTQQLAPEPSSKRKKAGLQNQEKSESSKTIKGAKTNKPDSEPLAVISIKQKLEAMTAMLGQSGGKMTQEIKSKLESDSKELLKKVKMMTATSS